MSEGTHSTSTVSRSGLRRKLLLMAAGTATAILAGGVLFQVFRAEAGSAGEEQRDSGRSAATAQDGQRAASGNHPRYLARVNGELIPWETVAEECMARYGEEVLDSVIHRTLIQQACQEQGITVTQAEVNEEIVRIAKRFNQTAKNWLQLLHAERDITPTQYRRDIIWPMLALKKLAGTEIKVTDEDLRKAFERQYGEKVQARMILCNNFRRAREVWEKAVEKPEQFGKLARKYSEEPNSRALDGKIPAIRRHSGNEKLESEAFKLKEGEISGVIEIGVNQYAILKCEGHTKPMVNYDEVKETLYQDVQEQKVQEAVAQTFKKIKERARIDNFLTNTSTGGGQSKNAGTARVNSRSQTR